MYIDLVHIHLIFYIYIYILYIQYEMLLRKAPDAVGPARTLLTSPSKVRFEERIEWDLSLDGIFWLE